MLALAALALFLVFRGCGGSGGQGGMERIAENYRKAKGYRCLIEITLQKQVYKAELIRTKPDSLEVIVNEPAILRGLKVKTAGEGFSLSYLGITAVYDELPDNINAFIGNILLILRILDGQLEAVGGKKSANVMTLAFENPDGLKIHMAIDAGSFLPKTVEIERGEGVKIALNAFEFIY